VPPPFADGRSTLHDVPPLAGYLPCWIDVNASAATLDELCDEETLREREFNRRLPGVKLDLIHELLVAITHGDGDTRKRICPLLPRYLEMRSGPPMLLFFDLNAARGRARQIIAKVLVRFQKKYGEFKHRDIGE